MRSVLHINMADAGGRVYCCLRNKVVCLDEAQKSTYCMGCGMFAGFREDGGVQCLWEDLRPVNEPYIVKDPRAEFASNQIKPVTKVQLSKYHAQES